MSELIAFLCMIIGVAFLLIAATGVLRFHDPFQRMHASTKAGTVGAGFVLVGAIVAMGTFDALLMGGLALIFLLVTVPVAGHLLGRAAYVSGAHLLITQDGLHGVLPRMQYALEIRARRPHATRASAPDMATEVRPAQAGMLRPVRARAHGYESVRFAVIAPHAGLVARRARALAESCGVPMSAVAVIDSTSFPEVHPDPAVARETIRSRLSPALIAFGEATGDSGQPISLAYDEGDPVALIPGKAPADTHESEHAQRRELLVLPSEGACHHGAVPSRPDERRRQAATLLRIAAAHPGPTLFVDPKAPEHGRVILVHDGSSHAQALHVWAFNARLWPCESIAIVGEPNADQLQQLVDVASAVGINVTHHPYAVTGGSRLPAEFADAMGVVLPWIPEIGAMAGDDSFWLDRIVESWRGDLLVGPA